MFRMRNTEPHESANTASAKPQGRSGLHADDSGGHSWPIFAAILSGILAGSFERQIRTLRPFDALSGRGYPAGAATLSRADIRADSGITALQPAGGFARLPCRNGRWAVRSGITLAPHRIVPPAGAGSGAGLSQGSFLFESPGSSGDLRGGKHAGPFRRVTTPVTRPTISASSGVRHVSGTQCDRGCGCITSREPS